MPFRQTEEDDNSQPIQLQNNFVGREEELKYFVESILTPNFPKHNIISISGLAGVGKSYLLARFVEEASTLFFARTNIVAQVNERQALPINIIEKFSEHLAEAGYPLPNIGEALKRYKRNVQVIYSERNSDKSSFVFSKERYQDSYKKIVDLLRQHLDLTAFKDISSDFGSRTGRGLNFYERLTGENQDQRISDLLLQANADTQKCVGSCRAVVVDLQWRTVRHRVLYRQGVSLCLAPLLLR